jgi:hypothetical protein
MNDGSHVWYLGGSLAEKGATMDADALIDLAKSELQDLIPWVALDDAEWATLSIARAEPLQPNFARPDNAFVTAAPQTTNVFVGWPTKLTLAPNLANQVLDLLAQAGITPSTSDITLHKHLRAHLSYASIAKTPWELAFPPVLSAEESLALRFCEPDEDDE